MLQCTRPRAALHHATCSRCLPGLCASSRQAHCSLLHLPVCASSACVRILSLGWLMLWPEHPAFFPQNANACSGMRVSREESHLGLPLFAQLALMADPQCRLAPRKLREALRKWIACSSVAPEDGILRFVLLHTPACALYVQRLHACMTSMLNRRAQQVCTTGVPLSQTYS